MLQKINILRDRWQKQQTLSENYLGSDREQKASPLSQPVSGCWLEMVPKHWEQANSIGKTDSNCGPVHWNKPINTGHIDGVMPVAREGLQKCVNIISVHADREDIHLDHWFCPISAPESNFSLHQLMNPFTMSRNKKVVSY